MKTRMPPDQKSTWALMLGLTVWVVHAVLVSASFPLSQLFSDVALLHIDSSFHLYQISVAQELWLDHRLTGYDPWFAAGHIGGVNYNASAKFPALLAAAFPALITPVVAYKIYAFTSAVAAPGFVLAAMRVLRMDSISTVAATFMGFLLWWISAVHWYHTSGMVSYVAASYAGLLYIALAWRSMTEPLSYWSIATLVIFGAIGVMFHPLFPIPIIVAVPFLLITQWQEIRPRQLAIIALVVPVLCVIPNVIWMLPSVANSGWADGSLSPYQKVVDIGIAWSEAIGRIEGAARGARLNPVLWLCSMYAVALTSDPRQRRFSIGFVVSSAALIFISAVGAWWPVVATITPNRLSAAAYLLMVVPAGIGIRTIFQALKRGGFVGYFAKAGALLLVAALVFFISELKNELSRNETPHYGSPPPEVRGRGPDTLWLTDWINKNTTNDARVLFETSGGRVHDGAHVAGLLALTTRREFIGGPYVFMHHAGFWDGVVFGKPISEFSNDAFASELDLYNIGWVIAHSKASQTYLDQHPKLELSIRHDHISVYKVKQEHSFFIEGHGTVTGRKLDRIDLDDVSGSSVILKYHYAKGLVAEPPSVLEPVIQGDDPKPFIRILAPARKMSIIFR